VTPRPSLNIGFCTVPTTEEEVLNLIDGWRSIPWLDSLLSQVQTDSRGRVCFVAGNCHLVMKQALSRARSAPGWVAESSTQERKEVEDLMASIANLGITGVSLWSPIAGLSAALAEVDRQGMRLLRQQKTPSDFFRLFDECLGRGAKNGLGLVLGVTPPTSDEYWVDLFVQLTARYSRLVSSKCIVLVGLPDAPPHPSDVRDESPALWRTAGLLNQDGLAEWVSIPTLRPHEIQERIGVSPQIAQRIATLATGDDLLAAQLCELGAAVPSLETVISKSLMSTVDRTKVEKASRALACASLFSEEFSPSVVAAAVGESDDEVEKFSEILDELTDDDFPARPLLRVSGYDGPSEDEAPIERWRYRFIDDLVRSRFRATVGDEEERLWRPRLIEAYDRLYPRGGQLDGEHAVLLRDLGLEDSAASVESRREGMMTDLAVDHEISVWRYVHETYTLQGGSACARLNQLCDILRIRASFRLMAEVAVIAVNVAESTVPIPEYELADAYDYLGTAEFGSWHGDKARPALTAAASLFESLARRDKSRRAYIGATKTNRSLSNLLFVFFKSELSEALAYSRRALFYAQCAKSRNAVASSLHALAEIYRVLGRFGVARKRIRAAAESARDSTMPPVALFDILHSWGHLEEQSNEVEEARRLHQEALDFGMAHLRDPVEIVELGKAFECLALMCKRLDEFAGAEEAADRGIETFESLAMGNPWVLEVESYRRLHRFKDDLAKSTSGTKTPDPDQSS
jgi:tetratricopeptide (TPR) repeat protein